MDVCTKPHVLEEHLHLGPNSRKNLYKGLKSKQRPFLGPASKITGKNSRGIIKNYSYSFRNFPELIKITATVLILLELILYELGQERYSKEPLWLGCWHEELCQADWQVGRRLRRLPCSLSFVVPAAAGPFCAAACDGYLIGGGARPVVTASTQDAGVSCLLRCASPASSPYVDM